MTFSELGLDSKILRALTDIGYEKPTPIQAQAIPAAMQNRDVLGIAQTGTGKTGAFTLPAMHKLTNGRARARMPRCLIVCPTRELAAQVAEDVKAYGKYLKLEVALLIGGVSFAEQDRKLTKGVDILIATPGRLLDQFERGKILMTGVQTLVVDEADRMLDMGFIPDIERIFEMTPFTRQVLFFSATMPPEIKRLVDQFLHQPVTVQIARRNSTAKTVTQRIVRVPSSDAKLKRTTLRWIIDQEDVDSAIVFCNRKKDVDIVAKSLNKHGLNAEPIHGDLAQSLRTKTLDRFKQGEVKFLVASDVAARGLDVSSVSHVFNFDVPFHSEDYIHRIGRTGRAGRKGDAIMMVAPLDDKNYQSILNLINKDSIDEIDVPDIDNFPRGGKSGRRSSGKGKDRNQGRNRSRAERSSPNKSSRGQSSDDQSQPKTPKSTRTSSKRRAPSRASVNDTADDSAINTPALDAKVESKDAAPSKPKRRASTERSRKAPGRPGARADSSDTPQAPSASNTRTEKTEDNVAPPRKSRSRKAAPQRKSASADENLAKETKSRGAKSQKTEPKPANESADSAEPKREARNTKGRQPRKSSSNTRSRGRSSKDDKNNVVGFGNDVPSFFRS